MISDEFVIPWTSKPPQLLLLPWFTQSWITVIHYTTICLPIRFNAYSISRIHLLVQSVVHLNFLIYLPTLKARSSLAQSLRTRRVQDNFTNISHYSSINHLTFLICSQFKPIAAAHVHRHPQTSSFYQSCCRKKFFFLLGPCLACNVCNVNIY